MYNEVNTKRLIDVVELGDSLQKLTEQINTNLLECRRAMNLRLVDEFENQKIGLQYAIDLIQNMGPAQLQIETKLGPQTYDSVCCFIQDIAETETMARQDMVTLLKSVSILKGLALEKIALYSTR